MTSDKVKLTEKIILGNPQELLEMNKEELIGLHLRSKYVLDELKNQELAIRERLLDLLEGSGEIILNHTITKAKRVSFKVKLEEAKELGATKTAIDTAALKRLYDQGVEVPHTVTEYIIVKEIIKKE